MTVSATKTVQIARSAAESYNFIGDPATMPQWAIHNVLAIRPLGEGRWEMETTRGKGTLIPHYESAAGILDHEYVDAAEGRWQVTARIVPISPTESVYMITLPKPDGLPVEAFEAGMRLMDEELAALKACIESRPAALTPVETVEALYCAFGRRDMPAVLGLLSPDVELVQSEQLPWGGTYRSHAGASRFFAALGSRINSTLSLERLIDAGDHIAAVGWTEGTVNATGTAYRVPIVHLWQVRAGQILSARFFIHNPQMLETLARA